MRPEIVDGFLIGSERPEAPVGRGGCAGPIRPKYIAAMLILKLAALMFVLLYLTPWGVSAVLYALTGAGAVGWPADRSSAGLLPPATSRPAAVVRIFSAPTVRWR